MAEAAEPEHHRVAIVGAGIGGVGLALRLHELGVDHVLLEKGDGVGGTWRWNTYPGAACDVPSHLYSYSFALNPRWSRSYARQPEILEYVERCADPVRDRLRTGWAVARAEWDPDRCRWRLLATDGRQVEADVAVFATGMFDAPRLPDIEGLATFAGPVLHSARWDHSVDLAGRRVGLIGTGASAVQILPEVAKVAARTTLFQRRPPYVLPRPDRPFSDEEQERFATDPAALAKVREDAYRMLEDNVAFTVGSPVLEVLKAFATDHLEQHVADEVLRAKLTPSYEIGCNRTLISTEFYEAVAGEGVDLVTSPIARVQPEGVETADGQVHELDVLACATGFQVGRYLHDIDVVGVGGQRLHDRWREHPYAYLGITVDGFPNLFAFYGPNTNQGGNSIILILEAQAQYVVSALDVMDRLGLAAVDVRPDAMADWDRQLMDDMATTVWSSGCQSYFIGDGGRVVTQLPHTSRWYEERTARFDVEAYSTVPLGAAVGAADGPRT